MEGFRRLRKQYRRFDAERRTHATTAMLRPAFTPALSSLGLAPSVSGAGKSTEDEEEEDEEEEEDDDDNDNVEDDDEE